MNWNTTATLQNPYNDKHVYTCNDGGYVFSAHSEWFFGTYGLPDENGTLYENDTIYENGTMYENSFPWKIIKSRLEISERK